MTPTPYPRAFFIAHRWYGAAINRWADVADGPCLDKSDVIDAVLQSFDDRVAADLTTLKVWHFTADFAPRDVTEDLLMDCGVWLSDRFRDEPEHYPDAFLRWADAAMQEAISDLAEADRALEDQIQRKMENAA